MARPTARSSALDARTWPPTPLSPRCPPTALNIAPILPLPCRPMVDLKPVVIALTTPDREAALAAIEQADAALGRALYCDRLAMGAIAALLRWLGESAAVADLNPTLDGWLGRSQVNLGEVGCLLCATFGPEVLTGGLPDRWELPLDMPDHCLGVVPVGLSAALDRAYLWGYRPLVPLGGDHWGDDRADGTIPLAPIHSFERLSRHLEAIREGVALVTADVDLGRQLRAYLSPQALTAAIANLELLYQDTAGAPEPLANWGAIAGDVLTQTAQSCPPLAEANHSHPAGPITARVSENHGTYTTEPITTEPFVQPSPRSPESPYTLTELGMQLAQRLATIWTPAIADPAPTPEP